MSMLKMNQHVPNKSADLLKKIGLIGISEATYKLKWFMICTAV